MLYRTFVVALLLAAALIAGATLASTPEELAAAERALPAAGYAGAFAEAPAR